MEFFVPFNDPYHLQKFGNTFYEQPVCVNEKQIKKSIRYKTYSALCKRVILKKYYYELK